MDTGCGSALGQLVRSSAEAVVTILGLLGFGLMWAGVQSLEAAQEPRSRFSTYASVPEAAAFERPRTRDWPSQVADLSWGDDAPVSPEPVDFALRQRPDRAPAMPHDGGSTPNVDPL